MGAGVTSVSRPDRRGASIRRGKADMRRYLSQCDAALSSIEVSTIEVDGATRLAYTCPTGDPA